MADDEELSHERDDEDAAAGRTTAPMSAYSMRDVAVGFVVAAVGAAVVFGVPLLLA